MVLASSDNLSGSTKPPEVWAGILKLKRIRLKPVRRRAFDVRDRKLRAHFFQIALAFLHEFLMRRIRAYTWAKRLGQMEAFGIGHVPPKKAMPGKHRA